MARGKNHQRKGSGGHPPWGRDQRAIATVPGKGSHQGWEYCTEPGGGGGAGRGRRALSLAGKK